MKGVQMEQFRITNQSDAVSETETAMKKKNYRLGVFFDDVSEHGNVTKYVTWIHKESSEGILTIISPFGEIFVYKLDKVKLEDL